MEAPVAILEGLRCAKWGFCGAEQAKLLYGGGGGGLGACLRTPGGVQGQSPSGGPGRCPHNLLELTVLTVRGKNDCLNV